MRFAVTTLIAVAAAGASSLAPCDAKTGQLGLWNETKDGVYDSNVEGVSGRPVSKEAIEVALSIAAPNHGHLAEGYASTKSASMTFSWATTENYGCPAMVNVSSGGSPVASAAASDVSTTYRVHSNESFAFVPQNYTITYVSPFMHLVEVAGLEPNKQYSYRLGAGCEDEAVWSGETSFWTPPAAGQATKRNGGKQVFAIAGDIGQTKYSNETFQHILGLIEAPSANETSPEALIIVGDLAYADGSSARWDTFAELMSPVTSRIPLLTLPGNHEVEFDDLDNTSAFVHFVKRYHMPGDYSDPTALRPVLYGNASEYYGWDVAYDGGSSYYSVEEGLVTFVALNTYNARGLNKHSKMYNWTVETLSNVNRSRTPWVVVGMHAPFYNTNSGHQWNTELDTEKFRRTYEELFNAKGVNFVFSGHVHAYERFKPTGPNATCAEEDKNAPVYITIGDGGNHEQLYDPQLMNVYEDPQIKCSAYRNNEYYGYGLLEVYNATTAQWIWRPNPEGSERVKLNKKTGYLGSSKTAIFDEQSNFVDNVYVGNYALDGENAVDMSRYSNNVHV